MSLKNIRLRPPWPEALWLGLAYGACIVASRSVSIQNLHYVSIWLPAGLYLAGLLMVETASWPGLVLVVFLVDVGFAFLRGSPPLLGILSCVANSAEAVAGAYLFRRLVAPTTRLDSIRELLGLLACSTGVGAALGSTLGAAIVVGSGFSASYLASWERWWIANAMAILLVAPLVLAWAPRRGAPGRGWPRPGLLAEGALIVCALVASSWRLLVVGEGIQGANKSVVVLIILWSALRLGMRGATAINLLAVLLITFLTSFYVKGLSPEQVSTGSYIPMMQLTMTVAVLVGLVPAVVLAEREKVSRQLAQSEERYRSVIEGSPEGIIVLRDGRIMYANPAAVRMLGAAAARDLVGSAMIERVHPDFREAALARRRSVAERGDGGPMAEMRYLRLDGTPFDVEVQSASVLFDGLVSTQLTAHDISRRKATEEALKLSEFSVREASVPTFWMGSDATILRVNRAACELLGYTEQELLAKAMTDLNPDLPAERWPAHWRELRERKRMRFEARKRHKSGRIIPVEADLNWLEFNGREYNFAFIHDITDRKRVETGLRESEAKLRAMFEGSTDAIGVSRAGVHVFANPAYLRMFGFESNDRIVGTSIINSIAPSHREQMAQNVRRRAAGEFVPSFYVSRGIRADGTEFDAEFSVSTYELNGEIHSVAHIRDITERLRADAARSRLEEQLRESQKHEAIGTLASGIAHDFNNILAGIFGFTALARESADRDPELRDYLDEISKAGHRAKELVRQILAFSRKGDDEAIAPVQMGHVVSEALKLLRASTPSTIKFIRELAPDVPLVMGNGTQLHQVVMNLGTNAVQAMRDRPGELTIALAPHAVDAALAAALPGLAPGPHVRLAVSDSGKGMDAATQKRVFEPFFTTKGPGEGTGLGLSVVYGIVRNHRGAIRMASEVDRGTRFEIFLPAVISPAPGAQPESAALVRGHGERILFVDDEKPIVRFGELALRRLGYAVDCESQSAQALARLEREPRAYHLVVADQTMPGMTGLEIAERIRSLRADLPVVLTSGHSASLTPERVKAAGVREVLSKPYTVEMLAEAIQRNLPGGSRGQPV